MTKDIHHHDNDAELFTAELDPANKSLSEALKISFIVLKGIMVILIVIFFLSGVFTVAPDECAIVLRLGKIRGATTKQRILEPGLHLAIPYPVDTIITLPGKNAILSMSLDSFWYDERTPLRPGQGLNPITDGYCLTRNDSVAGISGNDYNIVHSKWKLTYKIADPELFYKNVFIKAPAPGQSLADIVEEELRPLAESMLSDAIIATLVTYSIDEAILSNARISADVKKLLQEKFDSIDSGIEVDSVQITKPITWPRQVAGAFEKSIKASQQSQQEITEAHSYAENTLSETTGAAAEILAQARAYRTQVVEDARASADYLRKLLPEYRRSPKLVLQKIYQDAIEEVLTNVQETIIVQPGKSSGKVEFRVLVNRDPALKKKK
ncbi:MAG: hypothetical protein GWO86_03030, partial [Planctomycetes bacterium]|nr:hypothetical protein [Planctomycetota bacterium]